MMMGNVMVMISMVNGVRFGENLGYRYGPACWCVVYGLIDELYANINVNELERAKHCSLESVAE